MYILNLFLPKIMYKSKVIEFGYIAIFLYPYIYLFIKKN